MPSDYRGPASWTTVAKEAQIEFEERRSRFIGICLPLTSGEEAEARLAQCRADYPDARHWVYAWRHIFPEIGGKYSDDGEPKGTAGLPVLDVLRKGGVDQAQILLGLDSDTFYIYHVAAVMVDNLRRLLLGINLSDKAIMDFDFPGVGFPV